jgi:hypothetical protein
MSNTRPIPRPWEWIPVLTPETVAAFRPHIVQLVHGNFVDGEFIRNAEGAKFVVEPLEDGSLAPKPGQPVEPTVGYRRLVSLRMYFKICGDGRFHPTFAQCWLDLPVDLACRGLRDRADEADQQRHDA